MLPPSSFFNFIQGDNMAIYFYNQEEQNSYHGKMKLHMLYLGNHNPLL